MSNIRSRPGRCLPGRLLSTQLRLALVAAISGVTGPCTKITSHFLPSPHQNGQDLILHSIEKATSTI